MTLYNLMREYEERRQALVDQLKRNPNLDPAVQHQIFGAIKEIEHFLKSVEQHAASQGQIGIDLARDQPRPIADGTKRFTSKVKDGTRVVFREKIPGAARKIADGTRGYFDRRRERKQLRKQIEHELLSRMQREAAERGELPRDLHAAQPQKGTAGAALPFLEPAHSSTAGDALAEPSHEQPSEEVGRKARKPRPASPAPVKSQSKRPVTVIHKGAPLGEHPKRAKSVVRHGKTHPSMHAQGKAGGQHKPHHKGRRFRR